MPATIPLSVVICAKNEEKNIEETLQSVHGWADEIIVVDDYSTDRT
ncbi:MAG TPA: glycosyltransferase, partial [Candidatus Omnitrophota bacterium]|nr:glycosyltransferase [Candidatus Omnitrophota bacterium]